MQLGENRVLSASRKTTQTMSLPTWRFRCSFCGSLFSYGSKEETWNIICTRIVHARVIAVYHLDTPPVRVDRVDPGEVVHRVQAPLVLVKPPQPHLSGGISSTTPCSTIWFTLSPRIVRNSSKFSLCSLLSSISSSVYCPSFT